ncbi:MAG: hypothetical protein J0L50_12570 [Sphingomonadales bacterium]|nr:hypothetical protein [Sphingomonadales bacterium]
MTDRRGTDERLAAWLDGAMNPADAAAFEAEMAGNPALAEQAAAWRANDRQIADALAPLATEPIDPEWLAQMGLAESTAVAPAMPPAANDNPAWWQKRWVPVGGALAAGLALVLLVVGRPPEDPQDGGLSLALDSTPALQQAQLDDGRMIEPVLTARAADGRWCREYRIGDVAGLACREPQGWKVEAEVEAAPATKPDEIQLAGGTDNTGIAAANARLGTADPLGAADEAALIASKWGDR